VSALLFHSVKIEKNDLRQQIAQSANFGVGVNQLCIKMAA